MAWNWLWENVERVLKAPACGGVLTHCCRGLVGSYPIGAQRGFTMFQYVSRHHPYTLTPSFGPSQLQGQLGKPKTLERSLTHFIASWSEEQAMFFRKVRKGWRDGGSMAAMFEYGAGSRILWAK